MKKSRFTESQIAFILRQAEKGAAAAIAAENGATEAQLMAWFGWLTPEQAAYYRTAAQQMKLWPRWRR